MSSHEKIILDDQITDISGGLNYNWERNYKLKKNTNPGR